MSTDSGHDLAGQPWGIIVNPKAAGGKALSRLPRLVAALEPLARPLHVHVTTSPGDATRVARQFALDRCAIVVAVGGDGTVNEVVNGLMAAQSTTVLGIIPAGRGSDFARALQLSGNVERAVASMRSGATRRVDLGRAEFGDGTSRLFVNAGGLGFDAAVAQAASHSRLPGSTLPYLRGIAGALIHYTNVPVQIRADGRHAAGPACSVIVTNTPFVGGGMKLVPDADLTDGALDLAVLGDLSKLDLLRNVPRVYRGSHVSHPKFTHVRVNRVTVDADPAVRVQLDGELIGIPPVTFSVQPAALRIAG